MQLSKKKFEKMRRKREWSHWEGKYFCDCQVRNIRKWLGLKLYGQPERLSPETSKEDAIVRTANIQ